MAGHEEYDFVFLDLPDRLKCRICLHALREPVQTECGHRFCAHCLQNSFSLGRKCPLDRKHIPEGELFHDIATEREVLDLHIKCRNATEEGCTWTGAVRDYEDHSSTCQYKDVKCGECNETMKRRELEDHRKGECPERLVTCGYCNEMFAFRWIESHKDQECSFYPLDCPQRCGSPKIPRGEMESHVKETCPNTLEWCPYKKAGCIFYGKRHELNNHVQSSSEHHLKMVWKDLLEMKTKFQEYEDIQQELETQNKFLEDSVKKCEKETKEQRRELRKMQTKLSELEKEKAGSRSLAGRIKEMESIYIIMREAFDRENDTKRKGENEEMTLPDKRRKKQVQPISDDTSDE